MQHPKMRYTYVGIDSHKDTHTAVFLDCFFEKLGEIKFENLPSEFAGFLENALLLRQNDTVLLFGLEDTTAYGRNLTLFLCENGQKVKHVNSFLVAMERKNKNITEKTDSVDAECAARVLLSKFGELPDAQPDDNFWILRTLVVRREFIVNNNMSLKNHLHSLLTQHYPNYRSIFPNIDSKTALAFFMEYPSPSALKGTSLEELTAFLLEHSRRQTGEEKARLILDSLQDTAVEMQEIRDMAVQSAIRQIQFNLTELVQVEALLSQVFHRFDTTLTSMNGIDTASAAKILSCVGDVKRFPTPAKLARYAGIAPVTYASGKTGRQFANQRGNRDLNSLFYRLAQRLTMTVGPTKKIINPHLYEYYCRKLSEGKTKKQALKCVQRRLVNIIWGMLTYGREYENPDMYDLPKEGTEA